jgi:hypothetical protein
MGLDNDLLAAAQAAVTRRVEADAALAHARVDEARAIRLLHLAGGSVREIARALGVSHQRIQQQLDAVDDGRGWKRRGKQPRPLVCSFCGGTQDEVAKLIAGPQVYICDRCVEDARAGEFAPSQVCSFCAKHVTDEFAVAGVGMFAVCSECLDLCDEIIADELGEPG